MSDGNFNRSLLPHTPYQSGIKMGKAIARKCAMRAFCEYISQWHPHLSEQDKRQESERFGSALSSYLF